MNIQDKNTSKRRKKTYAILICLFLALIVGAVIIYFTKKNSPVEKEGFGTIEIRLSGTGGSVVMKEAGQGEEHVLIVDSKGNRSYYDPKESDSAVGVDENGTSLYVKGSTWSSLHLTVTPEEGYVIEKYTVDGSAVDLPGGVFETDESFPDGSKVIEIEFRAD